MNINPLQSEFRNAQFSQLPRLLGKPRRYVYVCEKVTPLGESKSILLCSAAFQSTLPRDVSAALRLLNMTKNFCVSAVNRLIRPFFVFYALPPFTPCHSERSRGISWKRTVRLDDYSTQREKALTPSFALRRCSRHMLTAWALFCPLRPNREQDNNKPL